MPDKSISKTSRRHVLRSALGIAGVGSIATVGSAKKSPREIIEKSQELRERAGWSHKEVRNYLRKRGLSVPYAYGKAVKPDPSNEEDGVSTQQFGRSTFHYYCSISHDLDNDVAFPFFDFYVEEGWFNSGEYPLDGLAFGWDYDEYDYNNNWWSGSDQAKYLTPAGNGISLQYNDAIGGMKDDDNWVQAEVKIEGGNVDTRNVIFSYMHTWKDTELKDVSVDSDGVVSVTVADSNYKWNAPVSHQLFEASSGSGSG